MAIVVSQLAFLLHGIQLFHTPNQPMKSQIANWIIDDKKAIWNLYWIIANWIDYCQSDYSQNFTI